jgi:hypothetical protein
LVRNLSEKTQGQVLGTRRYGSKCPSGLGNELIDHGLVGIDVLGAEESSIEKTHRLASL